MTADLRVLAAGQPLWLGPGSPLRVLSTTRGWVLVLEGAVTFEDGSFPEKEVCWDRGCAQKQENIVEVVWVSKVKKI